jgi:NAD(P)-dependent dehydrogenase (short-subunit alcohol dehydrogenase family)
VGLRSHFVANYYAVPLLIANGRGLIVNTGHSVSYHLGPIYGAQKAGSDKMVADVAKELRPYDVAAVSIWMGNVDTERSKAYYATAPQEVRDRLRLESPQFTGRVITYASEELMPLSGQALIGAELAERLGVLDSLR